MNSRTDEEKIRPAFLKQEGGEHFWRETGTQRGERVDEVMDGSPSLSHHLSQPEVEGSLRFPH